MYRKQQEMKVDEEIKCGVVEEGRNSKAAQSWRGSYIWFFERVRTYRMCRVVSSQVPHEDGSKRQMIYISDAGHAFLHSADWGSGVDMALVPYEAYISKIGC